MPFKLMLKNILSDVRDFWMYDIRAKGPDFDLASLRSIPSELNIKMREDGEGFMILSDDLPGFVIHTPRLDVSADIIRDALFVYFDVPRYYIKRLSGNAGMVKDKDGRVLSVGSEQLSDKIFKSEGTLKYISR